MTVFLASGTTVARLAGALHRYENLTVITNGLETANALRSHLSAKVILPGGELHEDYDLVGTLTERTIEQCNADLFFFSCSGITAEGFTCMDLARLSVIEKMKKHSQKTVLLVDGAKLGKKYTYRGFGFDEIDYVVMDTRPADARLRRVLGKKLITSKSLLP
jgi:DeoR/GlpR family transcriptional regulator of sugar metabolism